jgi:hypothetical protein
MTTAEMLDFELLANIDVSHAMAITSSTIFVVFRDGSCGLLARTDDAGWHWCPKNNGELDAVLREAGGYNA